MMESLTAALVESAAKIIDEVEEMGGMAKAVASGVGATPCTRTAGLLGCGTNAVRNTTTLD
jgi:methylmalonyl-CoA mutase N-terminal domain/subunit